MSCSDFIPWRQVQLNLYSFTSLVACHMTKSLVIEVQLIKLSKSSSPADTR